MQWLNELSADWARQGMSVQPGCTAHELQRWEQHGIRLPQEFRRYFAQANGMDPFTATGTDKRGFYFYALSELQFYPQVVDFALEPPVPALAGKKCLLFADYMHKSWWYGLLFAGAAYSVIEIAAPNTYAVVADSFREFVHLYLADADELYSARATRP
ncbi:SMI1/KNR4 family protein [Hymenobacter psychrotolerans]|uniref:SMI1/KNR4 family protein n=1 Tax=Hymenobacter psychrotolerans TaxID=344998 RepID=UPI000935029F|nr:SMI1/KNR4 family protein [Hymenobacter psychrotolerans]